MVRNKGHRRQWGFTVSTRSRRVDDRIKELCARLVASKDSDDVNLILPELRAALHQSIERLRIRAVAVLSGHRNSPRKGAKAIERPSGSRPPG